MLVRSIALFVLSCLLLLTACDSKSPNKPVQPDDYLFYAWCGCDGDVYYAIHTTTDKIDSIPLLYYYAWYGLQVSADGSELYIATSQDVRVIQLSDRTEIGSIPHKAYEDMQVSPDGNYIAIAGESLAVYSTIDYSTVYHAPGEIYAVTFANGGKVLYYADRTASPYVVRRVDLESGAVIDFPWPDGSITELRVRADESRWYVYSQFGPSTGRFDVYDAALDSVVFREWLDPGYGTLQLSPDERWVAYSYPGPLYLDGDGGPSQFTLFDATQDRIKMIVNTAAIDDGWNPAYMPIGEVEFTADSRVLLASKAFGAPGAGSFLLFDLQTLAVFRYVEMEGLIGNFSSQLQP